MTPITWTEAHRIEARRRCYEIAAVMAESLPDWQPGALIASYGSAESMRLVLRAMGCDPARIARELRRVDGLATGRLVRTVRWRVRTVYPASAGSTHDMLDRDEAQRCAVVDPTRRRVVRPPRTLRRWPTWSETRARRVTRRRIDVAWERARRRFVVRSG